MFLGVGVGVGAFGVENVFLLPATKRFDGRTSGREKKAQQGKRIIVHNSLLGVLAPDNVDGVIDVVLPVVVNERRWRHSSRSGTVRVAVGELYPSAKSARKRQASNRHSPQRTCYHLTYIADWNADLQILFVVVGLGSPSPVHYSAKKGDI